MLTPIAAGLALLMTSGCRREPTNPPPPSAKSAAPATSGQPETATVPESTQTQQLPESFTQVIPDSLVEFTMLLVPGDEQRGISPFYLEKHEVTWDEFGPWALCEDISEKKAILQREKKLRPSAPHDSEGIYRGWGRAGQPAVGMSRTAAEIYCQWLSQQTDRTYRLPTRTEWEYAFEKGGLPLDQPLEAEPLDAIAWHSGNTLNEETFDNRAMPVGQLQANAIGLHDMLGNVAEWVTDTGDERVVRGGCFLTTADQLTGSFRAVEDQQIWNKNYPNDPKSMWWYVDADYVGFRVVCEPQ